MYQMQPRKPKLGQNFLSDDRARHRIADALGDISQKTVIEIGPGKGAITNILAERAGKLICIELDRELAPALKERFATRENIQIVEADILETELASFLPDGEKAEVIGNLPYYITSDILLHLFAASTHLHRAVIMMQREVAERVAAEPGTRDFGLLSATAQMCARVENLFTLPPGAFTPPPDVHSTVLRLTFAPRFDELQVEPASFNSFLRECFRQKRKTLSNNLRSAGFSPEAIAAACEAAGVSPQVRAEALPLESLSTISRKLQS